MQTSSLVATLFSVIAVAQPNPGSIAAFPLPLSGAPSCIDSRGNVYATSSTMTNVVVTTGAAQTQWGGGTCIGGPRPGPIPCPDAVVVKADPNGNIVFGTLLGGSTADNGTALAVDSNQNVYVAGQTGGAFPTTSGVAIPNSTTSRTFAAKISADGSTFLFSTYLPDIVQTPLAIAVDAGGNATIVGGTVDKRAFVLRLSADGSSILYTKIFGSGSSAESAVAVAIDKSGNSIVAGNTVTPGFPVTPGALQSTLRGPMNAFLLSLDPSGNIVFSTLLGGSGSDQAYDLQIDAEGDLYLAGMAQSLDFPTTTGTFQPQPVIPLWSYFPGGFVARISGDGSSLRYSTYVSSGAVKLALGSSGDVYVAGGAGPGFPTTDSAPLPCSPGTAGTAGGRLLAHLNAAGELQDATYVADYSIGSALVFQSDGSLEFVASQLIKLRFGDPGWIAPNCVTNTLLNSATFAGSSASPGEFVSLSGRGIGPADGATALPGATSTTTSLGGVRVLFDGIAAPVLYAQARQINAQVPFEISGKTSTVVTLEYNGAALATFAIPVRAADPGLFRLQPNLSAQAYAVNEDGTINGPANPAARGSVIALWGTGFGSISPGCPTGGMNPPYAVNLESDLSVVIVPATTVYAGSAPTLACGVAQINVRISTDATPGTVLLNSEVMPAQGARITPQSSPSIIYVK